MRLENTATIPRSELILGRADCPSGAAVGQAVYIAAPKVGARYQVAVADPADPSKMPAVGIITSKQSPTECVVQFHGPVKGLYVGLVPGVEYVVGTDGSPAAVGDLTYPAAGGSTVFQQLGVATDTQELLLHPQVARFGSPQGDSRYYGQPVLGVQDGVNVTFTTAIPFVSSGPRAQVLTVNGVRQEPGVGCDYVVSESVPGGGFDTITMAYPPIADDVLRIDFDPDL